MNPEIKTRMVFGQVRAVNVPPAVPPKYKSCGCGQPAVRISNGAGVCARCDAIEQRMYGTGDKRAGFKRAGRNDANIFGETNP